MTNGKKQAVSGVNGREIVLDLLMEWEKEKLFSHKLIRDVLNKYDYLSGQEKGFIKRHCAISAVAFVMNSEFFLIPVKQRSHPMRRWHPSAFLL